MSWIELPQSDCKSTKSPWYVIGLSRTLFWFTVTYFCTLSWLQYSDSFLTPLIIFLKGMVFFFSSWSNDWIVRFLPLALKSPERCNLFGLLGNFQRYEVLRLGKFPNKLRHFPCKYLYVVSVIRPASVVYLYTLRRVLNGGCPFSDDRLWLLHMLVFKCSHCSYCIDQRDASPND